MPFGLLAGARRAPRSGVPVCTNAETTQSAHAKKKRVFDICEGAMTIETGEQVRSQAGGPPRAVLTIRARADDAARHES